VGVAVFADGLDDLSNGGNLIAHPIGDREPAEPVGDFGGLGFPNRIVAAIDSGQDLLRMRARQGLPHRLRVGAQIGRQGRHSCHVISRR
jgi:hypothetical protein